MYRYPVVPKNVWVSVNAPAGLRFFTSLAPSGTAVRAIRGYGRCRGGESIRHTTAMEGVSRIFRGIFHRTHAR